MIFSSPSLEVLYEIIIGFKPAFVNYFILICRYYLIFQTFAYNYIPYIPAASPYLFPLIVYIELSTLNRSAHLAENPVCPEVCSSEIHVPGSELIRNPCVRQDHHLNLYVKKDRHGTEQWYHACSGGSVFLNPVLILSQSCLSPASVLSYVRREGILQ